MCVYQYQFHKLIIMNKICSWQLNNEHFCVSFQVSQKVILQRASDGTPLQWFEEEDSEIVSQV